MPRSRNAVLVAAIAIGLAACSSSTPKAAAPTTSTTSGSSGSPSSASGGSSPSTSASSGASATTGACADLDASTADAYSGLAQPGTLVATPTGTTGCTYSGPKGQALTVTITAGTSAFAAAPGSTVTISLLDQAKWDESTKTLTAVTSGQTVSIQYGPAATQSDQGIAGNAAQFISRKLQGK